MTINKFCILHLYVRTMIILMFALFLLFLRGGAAAQTADSVRTWRYEGTTVTLSGTTLRVSGKGKMANYVLGSPWHEFPAAEAIIEDGVTHIGGKAFMFMSGLKSVTIPNSVVSIEEEAFRGTGLTSVTIPRGVKSIFVGFSQDAFSGCADLESINVAPDNTVYSSEDGVLFNKDKTVLILYPMGKKGAYTIPGSVKAIGHRAFANNLNITSITIPGSVESVSTEAFAGCDSLITVTIEDGVKSIEYLAFCGCDGLKYVTIPRSAVSISSRAFAGCTGLVSIKVADDNPNYSSEDGALFNKDKTVLIHYPQGKSQVSYTIPGIVYYKAIALSILTALILFALIFVIIKKTPKSSGRKRAAFIVTAVALSAVALFAVYADCKDATAFRPKIKINPRKGGTASIVESVGATFAVFAKASDGYVFTGWSGASNLTINPLIFTLSGDKRLTANFKRYEPRTVQIGNRRWMAENLNVVVGNSWCYDNDESNCRKYGRLYDYRTAMEACPAGWRLPTKDDWNSLIRAGGYNAGKKLKSKNGWADRECHTYDDILDEGDFNFTKKTDCPENMSGNGTDEFGFSALPGGEGQENDFNYVGKVAQWWTNSNYEWYQLDWDRDDLEDARCIGCGGEEGKSIRCVQDIPGVTEKIVSFDDPPPPIVKSWESGATTVTYYANGLLRVSGNGEMEGCDPPWVEYSRYPSRKYCNSPWRFYPVAGLIIDDGVTHIGSHAFNGCYAMSYVTIPSSVVFIGRKAFRYCISLRSIIIRNPSPPEIDGKIRNSLQSPVIVSADEVFEKYHEDIMNEACLYVPENSINAYRAAEGWKEFGCIKGLESAPKGI